MKFIKNGLQKDINLFYISTSNFSYSKILFKNSKLSLEFKTKICIGKYIIDSLLGIIQKTSPEWIFTVQDFSYYDQCAAKAAKISNVKSITHQHGIIADLSYFKNFYSDYIVVWGEQSKRRLLPFILGEKILVLGTDKFNYLIKNPKKVEEKRFLTLATNSFSLIENISEMKVFLKLTHSDILENYKFIVKIHPRMNEFLYKVILRFSSFFLKIRSNVEIIKKDNINLLDNSKILIGYNSTILLEGIIAGSSVVILNVENKNKEDLFGIDDNSFVLMSKLKDEIEKRIKNEKYYQNILEQQQKVLKQNICSIHPVEEETKFIIKLKVN